MSDEKRGRTRRADVTDGEGRKVAELTMEEAPARKPRKPRSVVQSRADCLEQLGVSPDDAMVATLTDQEVAFCREMVANGMNRERSYRNAFGEREGEKGVSSTTVAKRVYKLLSREDVRRFLRFAIEKSMGIEADNIDAQLLHTYMERAFYDIADFSDSDGNLIPLERIPESKRCVIDGIERKYYGKDADVCVVTYRLADRGAALKALNDYADELRRDRHRRVPVTELPERMDEDADPAERYAAMDDEELAETIRRLGKEA